VDGNDDDGSLGLRQNTAMVLIVSHYYGISGHGDHICPVELEAEADSSFW